MNQRVGLLNSRTFPEFCHKATMGGFTRISFNVDITRNCDRRNFVADGEVHGAKRGLRGRKYADILTCRFTLKIR